MSTERSSLVTGQPNPAYDSVPMSPVASAGTDNVDAVVAAEDPRKRRELIAMACALAFCFVFMIVELTGGYLAHSLAILTDAAHLATDVGAYALGIVSLRLAARASSSRFSYGWHRAEVVGTLASVFTIWALVGAISVEAVNRSYAMYQCAKYREHARMECTGVDSRLLAIIGTLGLIVNFACAGILWMGGTHGHSHHGHDGGKGGDDHGHSHSGGGDHGHSHDGGEEGEDGPPPQRGFAINAAFLHALSDSVQSAGVVLAGIFMYVMLQRTEGTHISKYSWYNLADPACSILFAVLALYATRTLIHDLLFILMEATPRHLEASEITTALAAIDGVESVHDLHVWSIAAGRVALSVHLVSSDHVEVLHAAQKVLEKHFGISHHTIQVDPAGVGSAHCASDLCRH